jgi:hypothetical protein
MTQKRDIDRVLSAWLADGASEMPDRLFDAVLDRIERVPQRRLARIKRRLSGIHPMTRIAVVVAAVVIVGIAVAVLGAPPSSNVAGPPSPSPVPPALAPSPLAAEHPGCNSLFFGVVDCPGNLAAGSHTSTNFTHPITYMVPAGWAAAWDLSKSFSLEHQVDFIREGSFRSSNLWPSIYVFPDPQAAVQDGSCVVATEPGIGSSPDALVNWVAKRPGIVASKPTDIKIGDKTGRMVDVQVASTWSRRCGMLDGHGDRQTPPVPYIALVRGAGPGGQQSDEWEWGPDRPELQRFIFVDIGGGHSVVVVLTVPVATDFNQFVDEATPIVQTMTFTP